MRRKCKRGRYEWLFSEVMVLLVMSRCRVSPRTCYRLSRLGIDGNLAEAMSSQEFDDVSHVLFRLLVVRVVTAVWQHGELSFGKMSIKSNALLHIENKASVRIEH